MPEPGDLIGGRYRVVRELGRGGFGAVYLVDDEHEGRQAAVKVIAAGQTPHVHRLLSHQLQVAKLLDHPNIARVYAMEEGEVGSYLVSEYLVGPTIEEVLAGRGPLSTSDAMTVTEGLAGGLAQAHAAGIIHRDIKPSNVVIPQSGAELRFAEAKLLDFGLGGELIDETAVTMAGQFFGTPYYMSPEQLLAKPQSPASDVYGLALLLYEMLTGRRLFEGLDLKDLMSASMVGIESLPTTEGISQPVQDFLLRCLQREPTQRPPDAAALLPMIHALRAPGPAPASAATATDQAPRRPAVPSPASPATVSVPAAAAPPPALAASRMTEHSDAPRRVLWVLVLLVATGVVIAIVAGGGIRAGWVGVLLGVGLGAGGIILGLAASSRLEEQQNAAGKEAGKVLSGARSRVSLTESLAIQVDAFLSDATGRGEQFLAASIALMINEYHAAEQSDEKQKALMNAVEIFEKLTSRLTPWYVRHAKLVGFVVSLIGILTGVMSLMLGVRQLGE
ncbi:MAG: serine/threonine-protein kinase [Planctomycetota bacterium]|nr:serine/threonine-protein kinase [Planctomycetota bacterium]